MENKLKYFSYEWDEVADIYLQEEAFSRFRDEFILSKLPKARAFALDVGCGTGILTLKLAQKFKHVIGADISLVILKNAESKCSNKNIRFLNADFREGIFKEESFDFICAAYLFHHYNPEEIKNGIQELAKSLRDGGALLIIDIFRHEKTNFFQKLANLAFFVCYYLTQFIKMQGIIKGMSTFFCFIKLFRNKKWQEHEAKVEKMTFKEYCSLVSSCLDNYQIKRLLPFNQIYIYWLKRP